jgi:hypothetical protein
MYFHKDNDRNVSRMDATIFEGVCGLTRYYKNYIKGYANFVFPLFELAKKDANFRWVHVCQGVFETLQWGLLEAKFQQGFHPICGLVYSRGGNDYVSKGWVEGTCDYLH